MAVVKLGRQQRGHARSVAAHGGEYARGVRGAHLLLDGHGVGAQQREARGICRGCPVRAECLAEALDNKIEFGVWGGMTERERRALLKQRPEVGSWLDVLRQPQLTESLAG